MIIPSEINTQEIDLIYLVANTPSYLYKNLRRNISVQWMGMSLSAEKLSSLYHDLRTAEGRAKYPVSLSYAVIAALSQKEYSLVSEILRGLPLEGLDWGKPFLDIVLSQSVPTQQTVITVPPRVTRLVRADIPTSSEDLTVTLNNTRQVR